ncbi:MAG: NADH-quinone oxidoreductase subunit NuoK [Candidatus Njordarchaeota archaeon]
MLEILLVVSFSVIGIGIFGLVTQKNLIKMLLSIEIMFLGAMMVVAFLALVSPDAILSQFIVFILALIAALEEAVGVGIVVIAKKVTGKIDADVLSELKG